MSLDRSLKSASTLSRHRNVLTRAERIVMLEGEDKWAEEQGVLGLPKVSHRKMTVGGKVKKEEGEEEAAAPAAGAKGLKGGAPAAKAPAGKAPAGKAPAGGKAAPAAKAAPAGKAAPAAKKK